MDGRSWFRVLGFASWLVAAVVGCQGTGAVREELRARDAEWSSRLSALGNRQAELAARFAQLPAVGGGDDEALARAGRQRLEASTRAQRVTLSNLEMARRQSVAQVEAALQQGHAQAETALADASARMNQYFAQQEQALASTEGALASAQ